MSLTASYQASVPRGFPLPWEAVLNHAWRGPVHLSTGRRHPINQSLNSRQMHELFWLETQLLSVAVVRPDPQVIQWDRGLELVPPEDDDNIFFPVLPWRRGGNFSSPLYGANANASLLSEYL